MSLTRVYTLYDLPPNDGLICPEPTLAQQHFKEECDINNIVARAEATGFFGDPLHPGTAQPIFGDFTNTLDFHEAQTLIAHANQSFMLLPADLRKRFNNDPGVLIDFLNNDSNREEAIKLGLIADTSQNNASSVSNNVPNSTDASLGTNPA